jgi:hypothetical protein
VKAVTDHPNPATWIATASADRQIQVLQGMTMGQRLQVAQKLYFSAREWKASALRAFHPEWPESAVQEAVRRSFSRGDE